MTMSLEIITVCETTQITVVAITSWHCGAPACFYVLLRGLLQPMWRRSEMGLHDFFRSWGFLGTGLSQELHRSSRRWRGMHKGQIIAALASALSSKPLLIVSEALGLTSGCWLFCCYCYYYFVVFYVWLKHFALLSACTDKRFFLAWNTIQPCVVKCQGTLYGAQRDLHGELMPVEGCKCDLPRWLALS